ncbi:MAG TPA: hypothetical protein VF134_09065 [Candidatus Dormibacteraeota bacterium]
MPASSPSLVPLSTLNDEGQMIMPEFWAEINGEKVFITAVLERTVVYVDGTEKRLTRRDNVLVDPAVIEMRPVANTASWRSRGKVVASKPTAAAAVSEPTPEAMAELEAEPEEEAEAE